MPATSDTPTTPIRLMLVDDHEIVREGLRTLLEQEEDLEVVGEAEDGESAVRMAAERHPDVVLMDVMMPGMGGIEATRRLLALPSPPAPPRVLMLTSLAEEAAIREAVAVGAMGYLMKDVSRAELVRAVRDAARDRPTLHPEAQRILMKRPEKSPMDDLTPRERSVLDLVAEGKSNRQIANRLGLTEGTVKGYVSILLDKLGVQDRTQAALLAVRLKRGATSPR
ncbi:MAG: response regulator transcription factor [Thermoanaerobaculia bacterium]